MILNNTDISTTKVAEALGSNSKDVGLLCTYPGINKWSNYKPINFNGETIPDKDRDGRVYGSGFTLKEVYHAGIVGHNYFYSPISPPYRLGDFRGYNSEAVIPNIEKGTYPMAGLPSGTNGFVTKDGSAADIYFNFSLPDINPNKCPISPSFPESNNKIEVVFYSNYIKNTIYSETIYDWSLLKNRVFTDVKMLQNIDLPDAGKTITLLYYLTMNGIELASSSGTIFRLFIQDHNDPSQWYDADITISPEDSTYVKYDFLKYIIAFDSNTDFNGLKIEGLYFLSNEFRSSVIIDIWTGYTWSEILKIPVLDFSSGDLLNTIYSGCTYWGTPLVTGKKNITINGSEITVNAIYGELKITNKNIIDLPNTKYRLSIRHF